VALSYIKQLIAGTHLFTMFVFIFSCFADYCGRVDFVTVYVREAHASDEWALGSVVSIKQHRSIQERLAAANNFVLEYNYTNVVVADSMSDEINRIYAVWPERCIVIDGNNTIVHISEPDSEFGYNHRRLGSAVAELFPTHQQ
jgi:hypothetical protein